MKEHLKNPSGSFSLPYGRLCIKAVSVTIGIYFTEDSLSALVDAKYAEDGREVCPIAARSL